MSSDPVVRQGDLFWISSELLRPSVPGVPHPHVVIQDDVLNQSRIPTTIVCGLSSNLKRAEEPGNVLLHATEGGLAQQSVIIVSQVSTVDKAALTQRIGNLSRERIEEVWAGLRFLQRAFFDR
jgi:mRNA interferase MazF